MISEGFDESLSSPLVISLSPRAGSGLTSLAATGPSSLRRKWLRWDRVCLHSVPLFLQKGAAVSPGEAVSSPNPREEGAGFWGE